MPSVSRNSLYRLTPDMMASLTMVRFHSSPSSPSAMALEFSVTGTFCGVAVIFRLGLGPGMHQPAMDSPGAQQLCVPLAIRSGSCARAIGSRPTSVTSPLKVNQPGSFVAA
jgi:hypothetical protein